jgi:threonine dehydrogenase-like Zn-dependent dehydrogenase
LAAIVSRETGGKGVDMVVDACGAPSAINGSLNLLRRMGRMVCIAETSKPNISFEWDRCIFKSLSVIYTFGATYEAWRLALRFMADGQVNARPMITHRLPLAEFHEGFRLMESRAAIKVILKPGE